MAEANRPLPTLREADTRPFWEATKRHELRFQVCKSCAAVVFFPRRHCPSCMGFDLDWKTSKGEGSIYTFTVIRQIGHPAFRTKAPYVIAWIDLDEGFRMQSEVVGANVDDVKIGQRVSVTWEDHDEVSLPLFTPA